MAKYKTGIALGGGGARGYAHLGVLQALKEKGIDADIYSGTSAGAIVGAFMASGMEPEEIFKLIKKNSLFDYAKITIPSLGLMSLNNLSKDIKKYISFQNLEDLPKPLIVTVSNMYSGKVEYLDKGSISQIVQASSSIPVLFAPVEMNGNLYSDGGIFDNLPFHPLTKPCDHVYAVHISPIRPVTELKNLIQIATRTFELTVNGHIKETKNKKRTIIAPQGVESFDLLDAKNANALFEIGYEHTIKMDLF